MSISILILTLDEEVNITACLDSVRWSDDVVVLDSGSTDRTTVLAAERGARVVVRPFDDYASQRNFGLRDISWKHPWVLMLDADEVVPQALALEMQSAVASAPPDVCLWRMRRRDYLLGTWIRGSGNYPIWYPRLARLGRVWVERPINEQYCTDGRVAALAEDLHHYPFNKGIAAWIAKHNRYSTMEAQLLFERGANAPREPLRGLWSRDPVLRRKVLKDLVYRMPARPLAMFLAIYVFKGGFLEGRAGLAYSLLRAWYEFAINLKVTELKRRSRGQPI